MSAGARTAAAVSVVVLLLAIAHGIAQGNTPVFPLDDAYITLHNAEVLVSGEDANYPGVPALAGSTSPAHLALVALLHRLVPAPWALWVAAWLGVLLYANGIVWMATRCGVSVWQVAALTALALFAGRGPHHLLNGLETGLSMAVLTWAIVLAREPETRRPFVLPLLCGTLPFLRPDLAFAAAALPLARAVARWVRGRDRAALARELARDAALMLAAAAPWLAWNVVSLGQFVPTTLAAKKLFFAEACLPAGEKSRFIASQLWEFVRTLGPLSLGIVALAANAVGRAGLGFAVAFCAAYWLELPKAFAAYEQRYLYVFVPFVILGAATALRARSARSRVAATVILVAALAHAAAMFPSRWSYYLDTRRFTVNELEGTARWCREHLPPDAVLLIHDAGYIATATPFRLIDMVGLKTPSAITVNREITFATCGKGRSRAAARIAAEGRATHLVVLKRWDMSSLFTYRLQLEGWTVTRLYSGEAYRVYRLDPPTERSRLP